MNILLVIDIQQKYLKSYKPTLVDRVNARIEEALNKDIPVVYVKNIGRSGKAESFEFADELKIESDCIFTKRFPSAFTNEEFVEFLENMDVELINIVGVDGRCCVYRTVMNAIRRGYKVRLMMDAIEAHNDKFYFKELVAMEKAGAEVNSNLEELV